MDVGNSAQWSAVGISVVALAQPWVIRLYDSNFKPGAIDIYETGQLEIGFSGFGTTIAVNGTLRARDRDQFVRAIQLDLTKQKDGSTHQFEWRMFRSNTYQTSN